MNFIFRIPDPDAEIIDKLKTYERIETSFTVLEQTFMARIDLEDMILNLKRGVADGQLNVDFNFNFNDINEDRINNIVPNCLDTLFARSNEIIEKFYGKFEIGFRGHTFPPIPTNG